MSVLTGRINPRRIRDLIVGTAEIEDASVTNIKIVNMDVAKLTAESILSQKIYIGSTAFALDGGNVYLLIKDTQGTPVNRIKLGKTGAGVSDYGLQIWGSDGSLQWDLTGASTAGVQNNAITNNAYYSNNASIAVAGAVEIEIGSVTLTTNGGYVLILGKVSCEDVGGTVSYYRIRIRKDSTSGSILDEVEMTVGGTWKGGLATMAIDTTPASTQTYKLMGDKGGAETDYFNFRRLIVLNLKK